MVKADYPWTWVQACLFSYLVTFAFAQGAFNRSATGLMSIDHHATSGTTRTIIVDQLDTCPESELRSFFAQRGDDIHQIVTSSGETPCNFTQALDLARHALYGRTSLAVRSFNGTFNGTNEDILHVVGFAVTLIPASVRIVKSGLTLKNIAKVTEIAHVITDFIDAAKKLFDTITHIFHRRDVSDANFDDIFKQIANYSQGGQIDMGHVLHPYELENSNGSVMDQMTQAPAITNNSNICCGIPPPPPPPPPPPHHPLRISYSDDGIEAHKLTHLAKNTDVKIAEHCIGHAINHNKHTAGACCIATMILGDGEEFRLSVGADTGNHKGFDCYKYRHH